MRHSTSEAKYEYAKSFSVIAALYTADYPTRDWIPFLVPIVTSQGLEVLMHQKILLQDCYRTLWNQSHTMGYEEFWARKMKSAEQRMAILQESNETMKKLKEEMKEGVYINNEWLCIVAKKV